MRKIKRILTTTLAIVTAFSCCSGISNWLGVSWNSGTLAAAKSKTKIKDEIKTINLKKGDTYKIKIKKNSKIKLSKKKIVSVSKKGKIKALKVGKCKITVKKGKKTWKYNVIVRKKKEKRTIVGGCMPQSGFLVDRIEAKDDLSSYVYLVADPSVSYSQMPNEPGIKYLRIEVNTESLKNIKVGDSVSIVKHVKDKVETVGDTRIYVEKCHIFLMKSNTPTPTPEIREYSDTWLKFSLDQSFITPATKTISGYRLWSDVNAKYTKIIVKVNDDVVAEYKDFTKDNYEFSIDVDFSGCKVGDAVVVYSEYSGGNKTAYDIMTMSRSFKVKEMNAPVTTENPKVCGDSWLKFKIDQQAVSLDSRLIQGTIENIGGAGGTIEVQVGDKIIARTELQEDEQEFSVLVNFKECKEGDKVYITYSATGADIEISDNYEHMTWPDMKVYTLEKTERCARTSKSFEILQDEITTETKYLTYKTNVIGQSLNYYVKLDGERIKEESHETDNGEFNLQVDFSSYEPGSKIVVGIDSYGYREDRGYIFIDYNVGFVEKEFILAK